MEDTMTNTLKPYTETHRDIVEERLLSEHNKKELDQRYSAPWTIIAYYLVKEQVCTIYIHDDSLKVSVEYVVPGDKLSESFAHALAHPDANFPLDGEDGS